MMQPVLVEFLGTLLLLSAVANGNTLLIVAALAIAICFGGKISGGYFNPAVTFMNYLQGNIGQTKTIWYIGAQYSAAIVMYFLYSL